MIDKTIKIGNTTVGKNQPAFIIAEGGVNHNGKLDLALQLVDAAKEAGADAIKFQTWKAEQLVTKDAEMAEYQIQNMGKQVRQYDMLKELELQEEFFSDIAKRCEELDIILLSTPHGGFESVDFVHALNLPAFKFGSGDLTNLPVLEYAAKFKKPMILGTGMANLDEVKAALECIKNSGNQDIVILHCTTNYPCPIEEVNLRALVTLEKELQCLVGYSDHTFSTHVPMLAVTFGACVIEKHLTLDRNMPGPDHKASMEPKEFKAMVELIRQVPVILGSAEKKPTPSEIRIMPIARKSVVTLRQIKKGEVYTKKNIGIKRPGSGLHPKMYYKILGKTARTDIDADVLLKKEDFE